MSAYSVIHWEEMNQEEEGTRWKEKMEGKEITSFKAPASLETQSANAPKLMMACLHNFLNFKGVANTSC